jgi:hypothetical protein
MPERAPNAETPVMLVPGTPVKVRDATESDQPHTHGLVHLEEVYRIVWDFSGYRSVELGKLKRWLKAKGYDATRRDRLRPLFGLKLQQEFGAHLLRVGPPLMPPTTSSASGRIFICKAGRQPFGEEPLELMLTRFKNSTIVRITPRLASELKSAAEELRDKIADDVEAAAAPKKENLQRQVDAVEARLNNDDLWIDLLKGVELNALNKLKSLEPISFVLGDGWGDPNKHQVVLQIVEGVGSTDAGAATDETPPVSPTDTGSVSGA